MCTRETATGLREREGAASSQAEYREVAAVFRSYSGQIDSSVGEQDGRPVAMNHHHAHRGILSGLPMSNIVWPLVLQKSP